MTMILPPARLHLSFFCLGAIILLIVLLPSVSIAKNDEYPFDENINDDNDASGQEAGQAESQLDNDEANKATSATGIVSDNSNKNNNDDEDDDDTTVLRSTSAAAVDSEQEQIRASLVVAVVHSLDVELAKSTTGRDQGRLTAGRPPPFISWPGQFYKKEASTTTTSPSLSSKPQCGRRYAAKSARPTWFVRSVNLEDPTSASRGEEQAGDEDQEQEEAYDSPLDSETSRIVGGKISKIEHWPWQASMRVQGVHVCGGSLVDNRHIATAAHCFNDYRDPTEWKIYLGKSVKRGREEGELVRSIKAIYIHRRYNKKTHDNDIALIRLTEPVKFSPRISTVCLPSPASPQQQQLLLNARAMRCFVTGYGATQGTGGENHLKEAKIPLIAPKKCSSLNQKIRDKLSNNMICAGILAGGTDSCQGDSGGPLVCEPITGSKRGTFYLHGIVSFGWKCAQKNSPGVYTKVSNYVEWLNKNIRRA